MPCEVGRDDCETVAPSATARCSRLAGHLEPADHRSRVDIVLRIVRAVFVVGDDRDWLAGHGATVDRGDDCFLRRFDRGRVGRRATACTSMPHAVAA